MTTVFFAIEQNDYDLVPVGVFESLEQAKEVMAQFGYTKWEATDELRQPAVEAPNDQDERVTAAILEHQLGEIFEMSKPQDLPEGLSDFEDFLKSLLGGNPEKA